MYAFPVSRDSNAAARYASAPMTVPFLKLVCPLDRWLAIRHVDLTITCFQKDRMRGEPDVSVDSVSCFDSVWTWLGNVLPEVSQSLSNIWLLTEFIMKIYPNKFL